MPSLNNADRAFTLIELLVVIAIIAILAAILFPVFGQAKSASKKSVCLSNLKQIGIAMSLYQSDTDDGFPNTGDPYLWVGERFRWPLMPYLAIAERQSGTLSDSFAANGDPAILHCPEDSLSTGLYNSTSYAYSAAFYLSSSAISGLMIRNLIAGLHTPGAAAQTITQTGSGVQFPSSKVLVAEWYNSHQHPGSSPVGWWGTVQPGIFPGPDRWSGARNVLFADLHAVFLPSGRVQPSAQDCPDFGLTNHGIEGTDLR